MGVDFENADIFCNFAEVEMANGEHARLSQALVYANKGKEIKARLYGEISPFAVTCSNLIARIFLRKGEYDRAEIVLKNIFIVSHVVCSPILMKCVSHFSCLSRSYN